MDGNVGSSEHYKQRKLTATEGEYKIVSDVIGKTCVTLFFSYLFFLIQMLGQHPRNSVIFYPIFFSIHETLIHLVFKTTSTYK